MTTLITPEHIKQFLRTRKIKALTKKQLSNLLELIDHRDQFWQLKGFEDGKREASKQVSSRPRILNEDMVIGLSKMIDANAHLTVAVAELIKKETSETR